MDAVKEESFSWKDLFSFKIISIMTISAVTVAGATTLGVSHSIAESDKVIAGVKSYGIPIEGFSTERTKNFFKKTAADKIRPLTLKYEDIEFKISPEDINLTPQIEKAVDEAMSFGRGGSLMHDLKIQINCSIKGRDVKLAATYDEDLLNKKIEAIAAKINRQPANAYVKLHGNGMIEKFAGVVGKKVDTEKIVESLKEPLTTLNLPREEIEIVPEDIFPFVTTEDVAHIDSILGSYSTRYYPGSRGDNIWIAANALNDKIIKTGWEFSFNNTVGKRTYSAGYQNAGVIIDGRPAVDVGGGVCQVSSTLYNAVLLSGLTPTERTPHYFKSTYIAPGRDATVADELLDFKFRNDLPHNVYLKAFASGSTISIYVLGTKSDLNGSTISIEREGSDMSPSIYRVYYNGGQVVKSEYLHTDTYHTS